MPTPTTPADNLFLLFQLFLQLHHRGTTTAAVPLVIKLQKICRSCPGAWISWTCTSACALIHENRALNIFYKLWQKMLCFSSRGRPFIPWQVVGKKTAFVDLVLIRPKQHSSTSRHTYIHTSTKRQFHFLTLTSIYTQGHTQDIFQCAAASYL